MTDTDTLIAVIRALQERHPERRPPTYKEIGDALGVTKQSVYKRVIKAQKDGLLTIKKHHARSIVIL